MDRLLADAGEFLFGPWTMILLAACSFAALAIGFPLTIMKTMHAIELVAEHVAARRNTSRERRRERATRARREHRREVARLGLAIRHSKQSADPAEDR